MASFNVSILFETPPINPNVKVFANVENVGDVQYKTASYNPGIYYVDGGRLASAGVTFKY